MENIENPADPVDEAASTTEVTPAHLQQELERTMRELEESRAEQLRARADFENMRKRLRSEQASQMRFANEQLIRELLPVLDNLDRAMAIDQSADPEAVRAGVELTRRMFSDLLSRFGVKPIPAGGQPFDPSLHEALSQIESSEAEGTVVEELERGYLLHDRVLRPARVQVAVAPQETK